MAGRPRGIPAFISEAVPTAKGTINNIIKNLRLQGVLARASGSTETEIFTLTQVASMLLCGRLTYGAALDPRQAAAVTARILESEANFSELFPNWTKANTASIQNPINFLQKREIDYIGKFKVSSNAKMSFRQFMGISFLLPDVFKEAGYYFVGEKTSELRLGAKIKPRSPVLPMVTVFYHPISPHNPEGKDYCFVWVERKDGHVLFGSDGDGSDTLCEFMGFMAHYFITTFHLPTILDAAAGSLKIVGETTDHRSAAEPERVSR